MIGYLQGEILENLDGKILVGIGDRKTTGAVGYLVAVPQSAFYSGLLPGKNIELFIYTHVREEAFDLYGFTSKYEKNLFLTLLNVNGIGPKSALGILSAVESQQLVDAIVQGDQAFLTRIPGIGKKTAERVVVELRDLVKKKVDSGTFIQSQKPTHLEGSLSLGIKAAHSDFANDSAIFQDAKSALLSLGYKEQDIHVLLKRVMDSSEIRPKKAEDLIKTALRQLA